MRAPDPRSATAIAAAVGGVLGALAPIPLFSVEFAQAMAGRVILPESSAVAIHLGGAYSLIIDLATALFWLGADTNMACRVMTAVMGALSFTAVTLLGLVFTRNTFIALLLPLAMFGYNVGGDAHRYYIGLPMTIGDLSANATSITLIALSLLALRSRAGWFLLGLLPAVGIIWWPAAVVIVATGWTVDRSLRRHLQRHWWWLAAGTAVAVAGWLVHQGLAPAFPIGDAVNAELVRGERWYWDIHRRPVNVERWSFAALFAADGMFLLLAYAAARTGFARRRGVVFWMVGAAALSVIGLINSLLDQTRLDLFPQTITALAMSRWLNLNTIALVPLAVGLVWYHFTPRTRQRFVSTGLASMAAILSLMPFAVACLRDNYVIASAPFPPGDEALIARARQDQGYMLAVSPFEFSQLYTSRAQLLDTPLVDLIQYSPRMSARVETILNDVFGASLLVPIPGEEQLADLESLWVARSTVQWQAIGRTYGVSDVMVPSAWQPLALPLLAASRHHTLYAIPAP
jgi:hypothetical protein